MLAIARDEVTDEAFNVGTGRPVDLLELLGMLQRQIPGAESVRPEILGRFREGDIRACYADITRARARLGYEPSVTLEQGIPALAEWVRAQTAEHRSGAALAELRQHGLVR
jgi:dTDP-L-rhamnose 4-epimerase